MNEALRLVLFGHPVSHSVSPAIHAAAIAELGLPHTYAALDLPSPESLTRAFDDLRSGVISGANVTIPFKRTVLPMVDEVSPSAVEVGAANVICRGPQGRLIAHNTDAAALGAEIEALGGGRKLSRAVIIGAGGAGLAAIAACKHLAIGSITVTARSWPSSESLREHPSAKEARALGAIPCAWPLAAGAGREGAHVQPLRPEWRDAARSADLIIQATSAGMVGKDPGEAVSGIIPWPDISADVIACDVVYHPRETRFLRDATERGIRAVDGLGMLVRQAALSFALWTGIEPPTAVMWKAAEAALGTRGGP
jgi:shikimate dehydrogenase